MSKYNTGSNLDQSRALVLRDAIESPAFVDKDYVDKEYNAAFVLMQYFGYLRRDPDQNGCNGLQRPHIEGLLFSKFVRAG